MYGGGFATIPAYLADMFGTPFVGAIHGRLLTAWSTAGILGPVVVNYLHDKRLAEHVPVDQIYGPIFYVLAAMLAIGWIANLLVRPVDARWHMSEAEVAAAQTGHKPVVPTAQTGFRRHRQGQARCASRMLLATSGCPARMGNLEHGTEGAGAVSLEPCLRRAQFEDRLYRLGDAFGAEAEMAKESARGR